MTEVLVIEDDPTMHQVLSELLVHLGYRVHAVRTGREGLDAAARRLPDIVLLDLGLPDIPGIEVIRRLRSSSEVPILVVSGSRQRRRKADALDAGADDFVDKPFDVAELRARLRVAERRAGAGGDHPTRRGFGDLEVDYTRRRVHRGGDEVLLTETEWLLLEALTRDPGRVVSHGWLVRQVWGAHAGAAMHESMRSHMRSLRAKLGDDARAPRLIRTEVGIGYRWICPPSTGQAGALGTSELLSSALRLREEVAAWESGRDGADQGGRRGSVVELVDGVIGAIEEAGEASRPT
jgi:two-component system KDP operon response regulator KdpE